MEVKRKLHVFIMETNRMVHYVRFECLTFADHSQPRQNDGMKRGAQAVLDHKLTDLIFFVGMVKAHHSAIHGVVTS